MAWLLEQIMETTRQMHNRTLALCLAATTVGMASSYAQTAAAPAEPKKPKWETTASLGATVTRGNSDTVLLNANVISQKKWEKHEVSLGLDGYYGKNDSVKNVESGRAFGQYNRVFDKLYAYLRAEVLHDAVADIEFRFMVSPGVGYYFIKNDNTRLCVEVGPGYVYEKLGSGEDSYMTLRVAERFEQKLSKTAKLWQSLEWLPQVDRFSNYLLIAELGVQANITETVSLTAKVQDTYDNEPAPGRKQNDLKLVAGVGVTF
jgi:putative salt-induced outer membrane protein YdiY